MYGILLLDFVLCITCLIMQLKTMQIRCLKEDLHWKSYAMKFHTNMTVLIKEFTLIH